MLIYVLNLLHDNLKRKIQICESSSIGLALVHDARYIASFAGIKKNTEVNEINNRLMNILEIIRKYRVSTVDTLDIFEMMLGNDYNSWIIEKHYDDSLNKNEEQLVLAPLVNDILKRDRETVLKSLPYVSENIRKIILKTIFKEIKTENQKVIQKNLHDVS